MTRDLRRFLQPFGLNRLHQQIENYPITFVIFIFLMLVFFVEYAVAYGIGAEAYRYWFLASPDITPGLFLGIVSHSVVPGFRMHVVVNGALLLVVGPLIEAERPDYEYVGFFLLFGYLTTSVQLIYGVMTGTSDLTTIGASGSIAAFAATNVVRLGILAYRDELSFPGLAVFVVSAGFVIWWLLQAIVPTLAGPNTGVVAHGVGVVLGVVYGIASGHLGRFQFRP